MSEQQPVKGLGLHELFWVFLRSNLLQGSWNYERMQALGYCFCMVPAIRRLYPDKEGQRQALQRHLEFFNTHPFFITPIIGVSLALEEQKAKGAELDDSTIHALKVGLMGPLAGVGDPLFWGTLRPVLAAMGAGMALQGSVLGPVVFFVLFNTVRLGLRWYGLLYAYRAGLGMMKDIGSGKLQRLTEGASILGLFVMGALVAKWSQMNVAIVVTRAENSLVTVQDMLNQLLPNLLPLLLTFLCLRLLRRGVSPLKLLVSLFIVGIVGYAAGVLS